MFPTVFHYGEIIIPTFFTMIMVGVLCCTFYLYFLAPKRGFSQVVALDFGIVGATFGIIGGRLFHVFVEAWWFYKEDISRVLEFWRGGFVSYGAFIGGTLAIIAYLKIKKLDILKHCDFVALGLPIIIFFVRVGCLGAGCCYGNPTDFFIHLTFTNPHTPAGTEHLGIALHATQVYAMSYALIIFIIVNWYYFKKRFDGEVVLLFFALYAVFRSLMEILRGDEDRGVYFGGMISTAQIVGIIVLLICSLVYFILWRKYKRNQPNG